MGRRDLLIVAAVVGLAGFAAADAIRSNAPGPAPAPTTAPPEREEPAPDERELDTTGFATGVLRGSLVFTDAADCRVREIGLAGATERPLPDLIGDCSLWVPPDGPHIAYGLGGGRPGRVPFTFFDLNNPNRETEAFAARSHFVTWSLDGQQAAWCDESGDGVDYEVRNRVSEHFPACPAAYTPDGEVAVAAGDRLVAGRRTLVRSSGPITFARWGTDGSLALVVAHRRLERWENGRRTHAAAIPPRLRGAPILSPDNCGALFSAPVGLELVAVCLRGRNDPDPILLPAATAAWSPDGAWIAWSAGSGRRWIVFDRILGPRRTVRLNVGAAQLAWRD